MVETTESVRPKPRAPAWTQHPSYENETRSSCAARNDRTARRAMWPASRSCAVPLKSATSPPREMTIAAPVTPANASACGARSCARGERNGEGTVVQSLTRDVYDERTGKIARTTPSRR